MSRTTQIVSIPLAVGDTYAPISSTASGVGGAEIESGRIVFSAGPDFIGAHFVRSRVRVQSENDPLPKGYKSAGTVLDGGTRLEVFVELPVRA